MQIRKLTKVDVLILDDWGLLAPDRQQRHDFLEVLEERYQQCSTVVTSQLPPSDWYQYLNDATLADAILDRLMHNAIKIALSGESMRKNEHTLQTDQA